VKQSKGVVADTVPSLTVNIVTPLPRPSDSSPTNKGDPTKTALQSTDASKDVLFTLDNLVKGTMVCRPSKHNRSPYVADVYLESEQREVIVHMPSLDMCGKCVPGATLLVKPAKKTNGPAVSAKYGTPKCEFIAQLLLVNDNNNATIRSDDSNIVNSSSSRNNNNNNNNNNYQYYLPTWVGAHPSLGERITEQWLQRGMILQDKSPIVKIEKQFTMQCEDGTKMRPDFLTTHEDGTKTLIEVKTVVDTDYACLEHVPSLVKHKKNLVRTGVVREPYERVGLFPCGSSKQQKGPKGESVVSTRAIKHTMELTRIVQESRIVDKKQSSTVSSNKYEAAIVFVVVRADAEAFQPNNMACPSFAKYLREADKAGVRVLAKRVRWDELGTCYDDKELSIEWPE
jgi:DNA-binding sugar fermentation-stimulating protein